MALLDVDKWLFGGGHVEASVAPFGAWLAAEMLGDGNQKCRVAPSALYPQMANLPAHDFEPGE